MIYRDVMVYVGLVKVEEPEHAVIAVARCYPIRTASEGQSCRQFAIFSHQR